MKRLLILTALSLSLSSTAFAQQGGDDDRNIFYEFEEEGMAGDSMGPYGDTLTVRIRPMRSLLIRPRASFVYEMFKTVEQM